MGEHLIDGEFKSDNPEQVLGMKRYNLTYQEMKNAN